MRNRLVITLCAVVSLLAGAGLLTFWLVRSLAPAAALNYTPWPLSPEPYTQADLDEALALRTEGYEAQSVAAFDRALADWTNEAAFHAREERIRRLLCSYEEDGPEAEFVLGTLAAAMGACSARHYGGYCTQITPAYADAAAYTRSEDMTRALKRELKRLDQSLSTQWMALEGTRLNDYFAYGPEGGETP